MDTTDVVETLDNLVADATDHHYSPYTRFDWVDELAEEQWWMTPDLLTVAGTRHARELDEKQLMRLSKWESINFFSLNIHGIRELLIEVTRRIHTRGFELPSEFFHRFLGEENGHMWFFAQFCLRYGGKIYPDKSLPVATPEEDAAVANFLFFARILIFEELVDHFNIRMGRDTTLHPLIREVNQYTRILLIRQSERFSAIHRHVSSMCHNRPHWLRCLRCSLSSRRSLRRSL